MLHRRFAFLVLLLILFLGSACRPVDPPAEPEEVVVLIEDDNSDEVVALYLDSELLEKHGISADEFKKEYKLLIDIMRHVVAEAIAEMLLGEAADDSADQESAWQPEEDPGSAVAPEAFSEIAEAARGEIWKMNPDGSHEVLSTLPTLLPSFDTESDEVDKSDSETRIEWVVEQITAGEAREYFVERPGYSWPSEATDMVYDDSHGGLLGDGVFYVAFRIDQKEVTRWLNGRAPWGNAKWLPGPIPADVAGRSDYGLDSSDARALDKGEDIFYAARDRCEGHPWHNGDLLILDPDTGTVRFCFWDF